MFDFLTDVVKATVSVAGIVVKPVEVITKPTSELLQELAEEVKSAVDDVTGRK